MAPMQPAANPRRRPRQGPRPLGLHLMTALCPSLSLPIAWPNLKNVSTSSKPEALEKLLKLRALHPSPNPAIDTALAKEAVARPRRFIAGVKAYQHHPAHRNVPEVPVLWQSGST